MGETSVSARGARTCAPATYVLADKATALAITCCKICILALIRNWRRDGAAKSTVGSFWAATDAVTICSIIVVIVGDWIGAPRKTGVNGFEKFFSSAESDELIVLLVDNELGRATSSRDDGGYKDKDDQDGVGKVGMDVHCCCFGGMFGEEEKTCDDAGCE